MYREKVVLCASSVEPTNFQVATTFIWNAVSETDRLAATAFDTVVDI